MFGEATIDARMVRAAAKELPVWGSRLAYATLGLPVGVAGLLVLCGLLLGLFYTAWKGAHEAGSLPPVASSSPQPELAPARPPPTAPQSLEQLLAGQTDRSSAAAALAALLNVWGYSQPLAEEINPNLFAAVVGEFSSLRVFTTRSTRAQLAQLNLPAILELGQEPDARRYIALLGMKRDGRASVALGPNSTIAPSSAPIARLHISLSSRTVLFSPSMPPTLTAPPPLRDPRTPTHRSLATPDPRRCRVR